MDNMANIKSAKKRILQDRKKQLRNKAIKSQTKTAIKNYLKAAEATAAGSLELLNSAVRLIDKAASKSVFHKNKSARLKSRLQKNYAKRLAGGDAPQTKGGKSGKAAAQKAAPKAAEPAEQPSVSA